MGRKRVKRPDEYSDAANLCSKCKSGGMGITLSKAMLGNGFTKKECGDNTTQKRALWLSKRLLVPTTIKTVATTAVLLLSNEKPVRSPPEEKRNKRKPHKTAKQVQQDIWVGRWCTNQSMLYNPVVFDLAVTAFFTEFWDASMVTCCCCWNYEYYEWH